MTRTILNRRRSRTGCSILALATVLAVGPSPAAAQSFLGSGTYATNPNATGITTGVGTTTINLNGGNTVINWTPSDPTGSGNVVFQTAGTTATFTSTSDFAVLNNINGFPSRAIEMSGTVNARVGGAQRGSVYFYAPGGFVFGGTSVFSVGSLGVSTLPISNADFMALPSNGLGSLTFGQAPNPNSAIIMNGTVNASVQPFGAGGDVFDSYVAMIAPRVVHNGSITVNGSAALVAAEAATINFSPDGLFDIQVTVGTEESLNAGINLNGDITGPTPTGTDDRQGIYLVTVPKNDAMTMVIGIGSELGFTLANSAVDDNGVIVLSAGHDIVDGAIGGRSAGHGATATGDFWFTGARARNNLIGEATGSAYLYSTPPNLTTIFDNDVTVHAGSLVSMQSFGAGASLTVAGNVSLSADKIGSAGQSVTAGTVSLFAQNGGSMSIAGTTDLSADGVGGSASSGTAGSGSGGAVYVWANGGSTLSLSNLTTSATGTGGNGLVGGVNAGGGTGGTVGLSSNGGVLNMNSALVLDAQGYGGNASGAGLSGAGRGGSASIQALTGGTVTFSSNATLDADGIGGAHAAGNGGDGEGGTTIISAGGNGSVTINGLARAHSNGIAGDGGDGEGGSTSILASGGGDVVIASLNASADGWGGIDSGTGAGDGLGGSALMQASGAGSSITINATPTVGSLQDREMLSADGGGGDTATNGATAGTGTGGVSEVKALSGGAITLPSSGADPLVRARGYGGIPLAGGTTGGVGDGGYIDLRVDGGTVTGNRLQLSVIGQAGGALSSALYNSDGGDGIGGERHVNVLNGGTLTIALSGGVAGGLGGAGSGTGSGGDGSGGLATLTVNNATFNVTGNTSFAAQTAGGETFGTGNGGNAMGGSTATASITNGAIVNIASGASFGFYVGGTGGTSPNGVGGNAAGGTINATIANSTITGGTLEFNGSSFGGTGSTGGGNASAGTTTLALNGATIATQMLRVSASGTGGQSTNGSAGNGTGGTAKINVTGGSNTLSGPVEILAQGTGGNATGNGAGGHGFGGIAELGLFGNGSLTLNGGIQVLATGLGGNGIGGSGGDGVGRYAGVFADGGSLTVNGDVIIDASGEGGDGTTGGDGLGGGERMVNFEGAHLYARNGSIDINGSAYVKSSGSGGNGAAGGDGGYGEGGFATIHAANSDAGPSSIAVNGSESIAVVWAQGIGGTGGDGTSGGAGGDGGQGGDAHGGWASITAAAGNGAVNIDHGDLRVTATGGAGGNGGNGDGGPGGNGGAGGNAIGGGGASASDSGGINVGTESGTEEATGSNLGVATFGSIHADASALGGDGGNGNDGSTGGNGGNGGHAINGGAVLLVRGSTVNVGGGTSLIANATGGDAGFGFVPDGGTAGVTGVGGDATIGGHGGIGVLVTSRYLIPAQRGTLNAGSINGTAIANGGIGIPNGNIASLGNSDVTFLNSDGDIGSLNFVIGLGENSFSETISGNDSVSVINGTLDVLGTFALTTPGNTSFLIDQGWLSAATLSLTAGNFITDPVNPTPTSLGTAFADNAFITTGDDFIADAHFDIGSNLSIFAPGLIDAHDFTVDGNLLLWASAGGVSVDELDAGGNIDLRANGNIDFANADAGGSVYVRASGTLTGNDIDAGSFIDLGTTAGISLGDLTADGDIHVGSNGPITLLTAASGETIHFETQGTLTTGNLTAGDSVLGQSMGAMSVGTVSAGIVDPSAAEGAEHRVSLASLTGITTGAVTAAGEIGFGTPGNLVTGNLDSGGGIMALVGGNITLPTVNADGYVFLADYSMSELGGEFENFDRSAVLAADPVLTGGSIAISGPLTADSFVTAAAGTTLTTSTIDAGGDVNLLAGGAINLGTVNAGFFNAEAGTTFTASDVTSDSDLDIDAGGNVTVGHLVAGLTSEESGHIAMRIISGGSVSLTDINALGGVDITALGSVTGGAVTTGDVLFTDAVGAIQYGNISAGLVNPLLQNEPFSVGLVSGTSIDVGNVDAAFGAAFVSAGTIDTGHIDAGTDILGLANGNIALGDIGAGARVLLADYSMYTDVGGTIPTDDSVEEGDIESIFAATPVVTNGSITVGAVNAGSFTAAAGTSLTVGNLDIDSGLSLDAGGALTTGDLTVGNFVLANGGSISTGSITADSVEMESTGGNITIGGDVSANGLIELDAFGNIVTDNITAGSINLAAGGSITTDNLTTELPLLLLAADFQGMPEVDPDGAGNIILVAGGNILTGDITAAESILLVTPGNITGQTIEAGNVFMALAHGDMSFGNATAEEVFLADFAMYTEGGGEGEVTAICIGTCGTLGADGVVIAPPSGSTYTYVTTNGGPSGAGQLPGEGGSNGSDYTTGTFSAAAGDDLEFWFNYVTSDGSSFADYAWASLLTSSLEPVAILFTARTQPSGTIVPGFDLPGVEATLTPASVPIIDGGPAWSPLGGDTGSCFNAGCGYTGWVNSTYEIAEAGNYVLRFGVTNWSDGGYNSGMAFSGITIGGVPVESNLISTGGSITIGNVNAGKMTAAAGTTLTTGIIDVTDFANLVSGGNMLTNAITAGNNLWADAGGTMTLGALSAGNIELVSGGNMSFASANATTDFDFSSGGSVTGGNAAAGNQISGEADGLVTINGTWSGPDVNIVSNDIDITASGSIQAGDVELYSTNATQTVVGDGVGGGGYQLSDAEFDRINVNGELEVGAWTGGGAADQMMFGDLSYTDDTEGDIEIEFAVFEDDSEVGDGSMRIVGDMVFSGMGSEDSVLFRTGLFELDAATGSVALYSSGTTLSGELEIEAPHIHVASGQILDQLADNPTYTGYQQDLNEAADVPRPDGVIKAASISLDLEEMGDSATVYVQNTGTAATPAGFLVTDEIFVGEDGEFVAPAGSINLIINGQIVTEGGTLTGVAVRDAMVADQGDITPFTSNSTINGCPLTGVCVIQPEEPPPNPDVVDDQIDLITDNPLEDGEFGNEDSIDDNEEGDEGAESPISPPQPLFDTRPLVPSGDVSDPVSGTGNPALVGGETECEEGEDGQCPAPASDGEGQ